MEAVRDLLCYYEKVFGSLRNCVGTFYIHYVNIHRLQVLLV